jgi:hypothetical protein
MNTSENSIEQLTQEMENAIDSLFTPTKKIEIDPLTNEIKAENTTPRTGTSPSASAAPEIHDSIPPSGLFDQNVTKLPLSLQNALRELYQGLMTIEWDMAVSHIQKARRLLDGLSGNLTADQIGLTQHVMTQMADILAALEAIPLNQVPSHSPKLLLNLFEVLEQVLTSDNMTPEKTIAMAAPLSQELNNFFEEIERIQQDTPFQLEQGAAAGTTSPGLASAAAIARDLHRPLPEQSIPSLSLVPETEPPVAPKPVTPAAPEAPPFLQEAIAKHTMQLSRWIDRLNALEKILAGVSGMEKLLAFHRQLKQEMAAQGQILAQAIHRPMAPVAPDVRTEAPEPAQPACPWRMLARTEWWGKRIAFPQEYIAFEGKLPWGRGKQLLSKDSLPLSMLKKWPWSGIRSLLTGSLSSLEDSQLKTMVMPILVSQEPPPSIIITEPSVLLLWNPETSKGCVILADSPSTPFKTDAWTWEDAPTKPFFAGILRKNDDAIYVLSQDIFS